MDVRASDVSGAPLTGRQLREINYHKDFARLRGHLADEGVELSVANSKRRRWWNPYWYVYTLLGRHDLTGQKVLVPGGGFCKDAILLASLGADVFTFDISEDVVAVARRRVKHLEITNITLEVMPAETLTYPDDMFDAVLFLDILHHVDIPEAMAEIQRVMKPGGTLFGSELYTHSLAQRIRTSWLVEKLIYPRMVKWIYHGKPFYITDDEHKIDEAEFAVLDSYCSTLKTSYFNIFIARIIPDRFPLLARIDKLLVMLLGPLSRLLAGRVVFQGTIEKSAE